MTNMDFTRRLIAILLVVLLQLQASAENENQSAMEGWELRKDKSGIQVYSRKLPGTRYRQFMGRVEVNASIPSSLALLDDTDACADWIHRCESSKTLKRNGLGERFIYQITDLPFPTSSRDAIFLATLVQLDENSFRVDLKSVPDFIEETRHVRIRDSYGHYLLEKIDADHTRLTWTQYIDPAGALPAFMVNALLTDVPFHSLENFRKIVTREQYQRARFVFKEGIPIDLNFE